jgi:plasmid stability protein
VSTLTLKGLPERLHRKLRARALRNRRSLNREIIALLEEAAAPRRVDPEALLARAASLRKRVGGHLTDSDLAALRNAGRR